MLINLTANYSNVSPFKGMESLKKAQELGITLREFNKLAERVPNFNTITLTDLKKAINDIKDLGLADVLKSCPRIAIYRKEFLENQLDMVKKLGLENIIKSDPQLFILRENVMVDDMKEAASVMGMTMEELVAKMKKPLNPKLLFNEVDRNFVSNWYKDRNGYFSVVQSRNGVPENIKIRSNGSTIL